MLLYHENAPLCSGPLDLAVPFLSNYWIQITVFFSQSLLYTARQHWEKEILANFPVFEMSKEKEKAKWDLSRLKVLLYFLLMMVTTSLKLFRQWGKESKESDSVSTKAVLINQRVLVYILQSTSILFLLVSLNYLHHHHYSSACLLITPSSVQETIYVFLLLSINVNLTFYLAVATYFFIYPFIYLPGYSWLNKTIALAPIWWMSRLIYLK